MTEMTIFYISVALFFVAPVSIILVGLIASIWSNW